MPNRLPSEHEAGSDQRRLHIEGMTAVVTGGASGIGKGIVKALLRRGATVVIADIEEPVLERAVEELSPLGPVEGVRTDVSDEHSVTALADRVFEAHGACNLLVLQRRGHLRRRGQAVAAGAQRLALVLRRQRIRGGHLHLGVRSPHDRVAASRAR